MENTNTYSRLKEFGGSDYEMVEGQPDIRGWSVKDDSGNKIGKVKDFLFDTNSLKVRYMIVDLKDNTFDLHNDKVLIPIGLANLDDNEDDVMLPNVTVQQLRTVPAYRYEDLNDQYETSLRNSYSGAAIDTESYYGSDYVVDDQFYEHDYYNDQKLYGKRYGQSNSVNNSYTTGGGAMTTDNNTVRDTISNDSAGTGTSVTDSSVGSGYTTGSGIRLRNRNTSGNAGDLTPGESGIR